jgi:hypothetical protein
MQPTSPVLVPELQPEEIVYAKDQPEYLPLPVLRSPQGVVLSRWKLSDQDRAAIAAGADILLSIWTFNRPLSPLLIEVAEVDRSLLDVAAHMELFRPVKEQ